MILKQISLRKKGTFDPNRTPAALPDRNLQLGVEWRLNIVGGMLLKGNMITNALVGEHSAFLTVFNQIERLLPRLSRLEEVKMLAELVEGSLLEHASKEESLASVALEHVPKDREVVASLHQDHHEIDHLLALIKSADGVATGRQFLKAALESSCKHFQWDEKLLFPLIEKTLKRGTASA